MELKKEHRDREMYHGSYREPETHTAADESELMAHVGKYFGVNGKNENDRTDPRRDDEEREEDEIQS